MLSKLPRHIDHIFQVGRAILVGRGSHGAEHDRHLIYDVFQTGSELQASCFHIAAYHNVESWLVDGHYSIFQVIDFPLVDVDTSHMNTHVGKASTTDETHISRTYYCYIHI